MNPIYCSYCAGDLIHPYFLYLLSDKRYTLATQKLVAKIGTSRHPIHRLNGHNRKKGYKTGPRTKSTKAGAGFYQLELVIGPFFNGTAKPFRNQWKAIRKALPRFIEGVRLAGKYGYTVYTR
jgi:hypothetical protein